MCLLIALVQVKGPLADDPAGRRRSAWPSFVWETRLIVEPSITRQIMIGAILIVMMNARPQGLLGARRVEVAA